MDREENLKVAAAVSKGDYSLAASVCKAMDDIEWTPDEYAMIHGALRLGSNNLNRLITSALSDSDRTRLHVMIRSFEYCGVIMDHPKAKVHSPVQTMNNIYANRISGLWVTNTKRDVLREDSYRRLSRQLNAHYLGSSLSLGVAFSREEMEKTVIGPLIARNDAVRDALPSIIGVYTALSDTGWRSQFDVDVLLDIAALLEEFPGASELVVTHTKERKGYEGKLIREMLRSGTTALSSGTL